MISDSDKHAAALKVRDHARRLLDSHGSLETDQPTGLQCLTANLGRFVLVEHQRQELAGGTIDTNGLDLWWLADGTARKVLSLAYLPFQIKQIRTAGRATWYEEFLALEP